MDPKERKTKERHVGTYETINIFLFKNASFHHLHNSTNWEFASCIKYVCCLHIKIGGLDN